MSLKPTSFDAQESLAGVQLQQARAPALDALRSLLVAAGLPVGGLGDQFPERYVVAELRGVLVGAAGLEVHGDVGLLRSVVVADALRGGGLGRRLCEERVHAARALGLRELYLLTTTAPDFFGRLGFERVSRGGAPETLQQSTEFASICPSSAVCMRLRLGGAAGPGSRC